VGNAAIQQLTGVNTSMYYAPTRLTAAGLSNDAALFATIAKGVISVVMTLAGIWLIGKVGRRPLVLIGQMGCTSCLF
ncbi:MFS transporter, partial [Pantoea agglomerans]|uniref:MFS transporter n=1 Tax=Enterobacter agglomerans TaxID=549 RepID=UPI003C7DDF75